MRRIFAILLGTLALASCTKISPFLELDQHRLTLDSEHDSFPSIIVKTNEQYVIEFENDCDWLSIASNEKDADGDRVTFHCLENKRGEERRVRVDFVGETVSGHVYIIQAAREYVIRQEGESLYVFSTLPGVLYKAYKEKILNKHAAKEYGREIWNDVKKITIEGITNAMDYACIKYNFRNVEHVDLSNTTVEYYKGSSGTLDWGEELEYNADEIPKQAFYFGWCYCQWLISQDEAGNGMPHLKSVKLPKSIKKIKHAAFVGVYELKEIVIPEGVVEFSDVEGYQGNAFSRCWNLEKVYLPSTLEYLSDGSFMNCYALKEVHIAAKNCPKEKISECGIPMTFGKALDIWNIGDWGLGAGYTIGGDAWTSLNGQCYIAKTNATLYVPKGCKENYKEWERYFQNIVEE